MNLREFDILLDTMLEFPTLHATLERSTNRVGHTRLALRRIVFLFKPIKNCIGFELRVLLKKAFDVVPVLRQRILAGAVVAFGTLDLAWQLTCIAILTNRFLTHFQPP